MPQSLSTDNSLRYCSAAEATGSAEAEAVAAGRAKAVPAAAVVHKNFPPKPFEWLRERGRASLKDSFL